MTADEPTVTVPVADLREVLEGYPFTPVVTTTAAQRIDAATRLAALLPAPVSPPPAFTDEEVESDKFFAWDVSQAALRLMAPQTAPPPTPTDKECLILALAAKWGSGATNQMGVILTRLADAGYKVVPTDEPDHLRDALRSLVDLKDGPRDDRYLLAKPQAWDNARRVLAGVAHPAEPDDPRPTEAEAVEDYAYRRHGTTVWDSCRSLGCFRPEPEEDQG